MLRQHPPAEQMQAELHLKHQLDISYEHLGIALQWLNQLQGVYPTAEVTELQRAYRIIGTWVKAKGVMNGDQS